MDLLFKNFKLRKLFLSLSCISFMLTLGSCDDDDDVSPTEPVPVSYVSLYHASPESPDVDVIVDNRWIGTLEYTNYFSYWPFYTGERDLRFTPYNANNTLVDTTLTLEENQLYSVFLVDETGDQADLLVTRDNIEEPESENALIRLVHLSPDATGASMRIQGETSNVFSDLEFKEASDFTEMGADTYDFQVLSGDAILNVPDIRLQQGGVYTVIVRGYATPTNDQDALSVQVVRN